MSEKLGRKDFGGAHPGWLALPLVVFALITLTVGLVAAMTLTPALLRLAGGIAFWPFGRLERIHTAGSGSSGTSLINRLVERNKFHVLWEWVGSITGFIAGQGGRRSC